MYKKIFEQKFGDAAEATKYISHSGWHFIGRRGLFRPYYLYEGFEFFSSGATAHRYRLKVYQDGHVILTHDNSEGPNRIDGACSLPARVFESEDVHSHVSKILSECNERLINQEGRKYVIQWDWHHRFGVYLLERSESGIGLTKSLPAVAEFAYVRQAYEWASSCEAQS
jgi:hypothetical protein